MFFWVITLTIDKLIVIYYNPQIVTRLVYLLHILHNIEFMKDLSLTLLGLLLTVAIFAKSVAASEVQFSSCLTPTGSVVADYLNGTHGIAGQGSIEGHDTVYALGEGNALQCLCAANGSGTQTNWLKISELSEDQIKVYQNQGWIYIPDGSAWGLSQGSYLAQNSSYSCGGSSTTNSGGGDGKTDGRTDGRSDGLGSIVQAAKGSAGLASTGNITFVLSILGAGIILTLIGLFMRKNTK